MIDRRLFLAGVLASVASPARAHEWYDAWCCSGDRMGHHGQIIDGDCQPIPAHTVEYTGDGWIVTLRPGDHSKAVSEMTKFFPEDKARRSQDSDYHACIYPDDDLSEIPREIRCLYVPMPGV